MLALCAVKSHCGFQTSAFLIQSPAERSSYVLRPTLLPTAFDATFDAAFAAAFDAALDAALDAEGVGKVIMVYSAALDKRE